MFLTPDDTGFDLSTSLRAVKQNPAALPPNIGNIGDLFVANGQKPPSPPTPTQTFNGPSKLTIKGNHPDYYNLALNDPIYKQLLDSLNVSNTGLNSGRRSAIQRAIIQGGYKLPSGFEDSFGDADPITLANMAAADQQGVTQHAQIERAHANTLRQITDQQAAHGLLSSGDTGRAVQNEGYRYSSDTNSAIQQLLDAISRASTDYAQGVNANNQQKIGGIQDTMGRLGQVFPSTADVEATFDPSTGLFKDPYGHLYDNGGNLVRSA